MTGRGVAIAPRRAGPGGAGGADRGSATAELAATMPALVMLVLAAVSCVAAVTVKLQCVAAAREAALATARGDTGMSAGRAAAPVGAEIRVEVGAGSVHASVRTVLHPFGGRLPGVTVTGEATAAREPGAIP